MYSFGSYYGFYDAELDIDFTRYGKKDYECLFDSDPALLRKAFDAVIFALFGNADNILGGMAPDSDQVARGHKVYVRLVFEQKFNTYVIERGPGRVTGHVGGMDVVDERPYATFELPDGRVIEGISAVNKAILGMVCAQPFAAPGLEPIATTEDNAGAIASISAQAMLPDQADISEKLAGTELNDRGKGEALAKALRSQIAMDKARKMGLEDKEKTLLRAQSRIARSRWDKLVDGSDQSDGDADAGDKSDAMETICKELKDGNGRQAEIYTRLLRNKRCLRDLEEKLEQMDIAAC